MQHEKIIELRTHITRIHIGAPFEIQTSKVVSFQ